MKIHEAAIHDGVRLDCEKCDYKGSSRAALKQHIKVQHEGLRLYCDECTLAVRNVTQLKRHKMKKHGSILKIRKRTPNYYHSDIADRSNP